MRVYQVDADHDYQTVSPDDAEGYISVVTSRGLDGRPMLDQWKPLPCHVMDPASKRGDFAVFSLATFAVRKTAIVALEDFFESMGEILPLEVPDDECALVNVTKIVGAVESAAPEDALVRGHLLHKFQRIEIDPARLEGHSLFRPAENRYLLFAVSGQGDGTFDFPAEVERRKLRGLKFKLIWSLRHNA